MNLMKWFAVRGPKFVMQRASRLVDRYGISPRPSMSRIQASVRTLARFGCAPTFFTPGIVVERYPGFIQGLQSEGAELAVHSYQHIDLRVLKLPAAIDQLQKALRVYEKYKIENRGFRCPYLSCSDELLDALPAGMFDYSSNRAIWLAVQALDRATVQNIIFSTLRRFYQPRPAEEVISTPWVRPNLFEIPVCVPDDLQLHDGIDLDPERMGEVWIEMLGMMHQKGELFNLIFHPELSEVCALPFEQLLQQASLLRPAVWMARLRDLSDWWKERSSFDFQLFEDQAGLQVTFLCSPRATILARGLDLSESACRWDGVYSRLKDHVLRLPAGLRPLIGLAADVLPETASFLKQQGYLLDMNPTAGRCSLYFDRAAITGLGGELQLLSAIENSSAPLLRFWRWPDGAKCAFSITGDLDAITLVDYATRLFIQ